MFSNGAKDHNETGYDIWSVFYDEYPNPTVAVDDIRFPPFWNDLRNKKIFETGCGTGRHPARLAGNGNLITAIDTSSGMINRAREKIRPGMCASSARIFCRKRISERAMTR